MHLFSQTEQIATRIPALTHTFVSSLCKNYPLIKRHSQQPFISEIFPRVFNGFVSWVYITFFAYAFAAASISHKFSPDVFNIFNCERKMSIPAKKCVSLNLSLMGCFGPIDSTSCIHSGSSMLSSTVNDRSFLSQEVYHVSRTVFQNFFFGFLMLSLSLPQLDASRSGKRMPTTVRRFLFIPVILLSLASPRIFSYPHLPQKFQSLVVSIENYEQLRPKKTVLGHPKLQKVRY